MIKADKDAVQPDADLEQRERVRKTNNPELKRTMDLIGAEAQALGLTEEILNEILNEEPTEEEAARSRD